MKFRLTNLTLTFKKSKEVIEFSDFHYFYGQMGAGKSTIARMIDYCFGGDQELTPALQNEFVAASLTAQVNGNELSIARNRDADLVRVQWSLQGEPYEVIMPARKPGDEVVPNSGIHVLSDLVFILADIKPPKVRRSKIKEDSELERLSFRDLLWYCYLDQDSMDSSFFNLEEEANVFKRLKSRDVLRFIVGYHQEEVAALEAEIQNTREERQKAEGGAKAMREALESADVASPEKMQKLRQKISTGIKKVEAAIAQARTKVSQHRTSDMESLQERGQKTTNALLECSARETDALETIQALKAQKNSLLSLSTRYRRVQSARAVLGGVTFLECPCCSQNLPERADNVCPLCGVPPDSAQQTVDEETIAADIRERVEELDERVKQMERNLLDTRRQQRELYEDKRAIDEQLTKASRNYDSAYLTEALQLEKEQAALQQRLRDLHQIETLGKKAAELEKRAQTLAGDEYRIRAELKEARKKAERDTSNLRRLETLFRDCLLRSRIAGFFPDDSVSIRAPYFLPEVLGKNTGDLAVTSFSNLGSGGKKTLFKCCFAVAIHRLATECGVALPSLLMIDSPMKNISERENQDQFSGFHEMLHELAVNELRDTQFLIVDKELFTPAAEFPRKFSSRHMKPNDEEFPPLIPYYKGK